MARMFFRTVDVNLTLSFGRNATTEAKNEIFYVKKTEVDFQYESSDLRLYSFDIADEKVKKLIVGVSF